MELTTWAKRTLAAPQHYSIMGYILEPEVLLQETTPAIIAQLHAERVAAVVLFPT